MGQNSSRVQQATADSRRVDAPNSSNNNNSNVNIGSNSPISDFEPPPPPASPASNRRSVRRSLINLVKSSSSSQTSSSSSRRDPGSSARDSVIGNGNGNGNGSGSGSGTLTQTARSRKWRNSIWGKSHRQGESEPVIGEVRGGEGSGVSEGERVVDVLEKGKEKASEGSMVDESTAMNTGDRAETTLGLHAASSSAAAASEGDREASRSCASTPAQEERTVEAVGLPMPAPIVSSSSPAEDSHLQPLSSASQHEQSRTISLPEHSFLDAPLPPNAPPPPTPRPQPQPLPLPVEYDEPQVQGTATPPPPARQFPPPGTLVVVQGIVHTTDVPRPAPASRSVSQQQSEGGAEQTMVPEDRPRYDGNSGTGRREPSRSSARSRLSQLMRSRPSSGIFGSSSASVSASRPVSRSASVAPTDEAIVTHTMDEERTIEVVDTGVGAGDGSEGICIPEEDERRRDDGVANPETPSLGNLEANANPVNRVDEGEGENRVVEDVGIQVGDTAEGGAIAEGEGDNDQPAPPAISSNSIDVLGTLLSVAAAATAASLLTGSSEPILQSPLSPESAGSAATQAQTQPTSASGTRHSHTHPHPYAAPPQATSTAPADMSAPARAERMRQAWATIRERLGLRSGQHGAAENTQGPGQGQEVGQRTPQDARELLLQEMARAFSVGLGLGNSVTPSTAAGVDEEGREGGREEAEQHVEPPPEGSFERFLVDLQADLRIALSPEGEAQAEDGEPQQVEQGGQQEQEHPLMEGIFENPEPAQGVTSAEEPLPPPAHDSDAESLPPLQEVSDSDDDDNHFDVDSDSEVFHTPMSSRARSVVYDATTTTGGSGRIDAAGRINWWRLYRFPAIIPPGQGQRVAGVATAAPVATNDAVQASPLATPSTRPSTPATSPSAPMSSTELPSISTNPSDIPRVRLPMMNTVIPVIVVGLQSVNGHVDVPMAEGEHEHMPAFPEHTARGEGDDGEIHDAFGNQNRASRDTEPRGWQSRAANAIRNLRPGRRAASRDAAETGAGDTAVGRLPSNGPGSRTFLIYVIGGYYPPDHTIVTSGANNFESFEALLELAELLGQVKPPTATREDIEKSGLEVIKAPQLEQYERDGRVSSNCTERCLICLDDYDLEDEVRVLNCRHAFHRGCVDKWLETGRNNCPACRSKGVSTETSATQAAAEAL